MKYPFNFVEKDLRDGKIFINQHSSRSYRTSSTDYDFLFHFFKIIQPKNILIAGGFSNCDLFYAIQSCNYPVNVINYDNTTEDINSKIIWLKEYFNFNGTYTYINKPIDYTKHINQNWDLIWDNHTGQLKYYIQEFKNIPIIYSHFGNPRALLDHIVEIDKHTPLRLLTRNNCFLGINDKHTKELVSLDNTFSSNKYSTELKLPYNKNQTVYYVAHLSQWPLTLKELYQQDK